MQFLISVKTTQKNKLWKKIQNPDSSSHYKEIMTR